MLVRAFPLWRSHKNASHAGGRWFESISLHQKETPSNWMGFLFGIGIQTNGLESRLLATVRWTVATGVAFPQKSESIAIQLDGVSFWYWYSD